MTLKSGKGGQPDKGTSEWMNPKIAEKKKEGKKGHGKQYPNFEGKLQ